MYRFILKYFRRFQYWRRANRLKRIKIIQGGMGIGISNYHLAKTTSTAGVLGTVSCTGAERVLANILQLGDVGGHYRRALAHFPFQDSAKRVLDKWFIEGGKAPHEKFKEVPMFTFNSRHDLIELSVVASFALVWLAKEGHRGLISVNYLEKLQIGHIYHLTGATLAGADYITMGAGITLQIPGVLDAIASGGSPSYRVYVEGSTTGDRKISFNPREFFGKKFPREMKRPGFLPIISTDVLANIMVTKLSSGDIQGFVVELPLAGGHNAPPRKKGIFDKDGQPLYGKKDEVDWEKMCGFGIPFWIGGGLASPTGLADALSKGACGVQCGSIFALSDTSGLNSAYRKMMRYRGYEGILNVRTDPSASPTGFPFKVPQLSGTISDPDVYASRVRNCSRKALQFPAEWKGHTVFRCAAEPIKDYLRKGGKIEDTVGARCLCNGLFSAADLGDPDEIPIFTLGDITAFLPHLMKSEFDSYCATQAINYLLAV